MSKMNLHFTIAKVNGNKKISKHQAGKKGYKHVQNLSKGQKNHATYLKTGCIGGRLPR